MRFPDLPLWHEKELALFGGQMDEAVLGEREFVSVNRLKLRSGGWFMGTKHTIGSVNADMTRDVCV
jgi:hypothetical protein